MHVHTQVGDVHSLHPGALPGVQLEINVLSRGSFFPPSLEEDGIISLRRFKNSPGDTQI